MLYFIKKIYVLIIFGWNVEEGDDNRWQGRLWLRDVIEGKRKTVKNRLEMKQTDELRFFYEWIFFWIWLVRYLINQELLSWMEMVVLTVSIKVHEKITKSFNNFIIPRYNFGDKVILTHGHDKINSMKF